MKQVRFTDDTKEPNKVSKPRLFKIIDDKIDDIIIEQPKLRVTLEEQRVEETPKISSLMSEKLALEVEEMLKNFSEDLTTLEVAKLVNQQISEDCEGKVIQ